MRTVSRSLKRQVVWLSSGMKPLLAGCVVAAQLASGCGASEGLDAAGSAGADEQVAAPQNAASAAITEMAPEAVSADQLQQAQMEVLGEVLGADLAARVVRPTTTGGAAVLEVELANGNVVSWHEPTEGVVLTFEVGGERPTLTPDVVRELSAAELFQSLVPGQEVPAALHDLDARRLELEPVFETVRQAKAEYPILAMQRDAAETDLATDLATDLQNAGELPQEVATQELPPGVGQVRSALSTTVTGQSNRDSTSECADGCQTTSYTVLDYRRTSQTSSQTVQKNDVDWIQGTICAVTKAITVKVETRPWWTWSTALNFQTSEGKMRKFYGHSSGVDTDLKHTWSMASSSKAAGCANMEDW